MARTNFENLRIYQFSERIAGIIWRIVSQWNAFEQRTLGMQLVRAADSIGANIAEGSGRGTDNDYRRYLRIARGSLYETRHWLRCAYARRLLPEDQVPALRELLDNLTPMLNAYLRSVAKNANRKREHH